MQIVYVGKHDGVGIAGTRIVAARGEPVDVPDALAESLLKQAAWKRAPKTMAKATPAGAEKE